MALVTREHDGEPDIVKARKPNTPDGHWWQKPPGKERASALTAYAQQIESDLSGYRAQLELDMRAYGGGNVAGEGLRTALQWQQRQDFRLRMNLTAEVVDAMQAKIAKLRPRPSFQVDQGDWGLRKKAAAMEQAVDGEFYRNDVDTLGPQVARDAFVGGDGHFRVGRRGVGYPVIERVFPGEIIVDPVEGMYQDPRTICRGRLVDREYLIETFASTNPDLAAQLRVASSTSPRLFPWLQPARGHTDTLWVVEAWHVGSGVEGARPGTHVIAVNDIELLEPSQTVFKDKHCPIVHMQWKDRQFGYYGCGIAEEIRPQQIEVNYTLEKIQHIFHNVSTVRHWIKAGGRISVNVTKMSNTPGEILTYFGDQPPVTDVVNAVPTQMLEHVINLRNTCFERVGLSQFFASSDKPAGLDSGEAQRVYEDVGTERLIIKGRSYEGAHIKLAQRVVDVKRAIAQPNSGEKETPVVVKSKRARGVTVRSLSFKDIDLDKQLYMLTVADQSALPGTPSGRKATVSEWIQIGLCSPDEGRELLNMPDLKSSNDEKFATRDSVLSAVEMMADDGTYVPPHPMLDVQQAKKLIASAFTRLEWEGCPEDNLELISRYAAQLLVIEQTAAAAIAPAPTASTMGPPAMPQAPMLPPGDGNPIMMQ